MKHYFFEFTAIGESQFLHLPADVQIRIKAKMKFFIGAENPLKYAKKLIAYKGAYRFRIGDYRVIVTPKNKDIFVILLILKVGHRREVYE